jgi:hypothetical protein
LLILLTGIVFLLWPTTDSSAIPTYARKYKTSCQTCHVAYPKLTPFGNAYRINNFEWPGELEEDEDKSKEEDVPLGAEGYKRVFPKAVWPGSIPGIPPISFRARTAYTWQNTDAEDARTEFTLPTLQVMMSGTFGTQVSFFVGVHLFEDGSFDNATVDRIYLSLNDVLAGTLPLNLVNLRFGQIDPDIVPFISNHRSLTTTPYAFNTYSPILGDEFGERHEHGGGDDHGAAPILQLQAGTGEPPEYSGPAFSLEDFKVGLEGNGVIARRLRYVLGVLNGGTGAEDNRAKDGYGRLAYKFGGMAFDGSGGDMQSAKPWAERSFTLGVFGYKGYAANQGAFGPSDLDIQRYGGDFSLWFDNLNLFGGYQHGSDDLLTETEVQQVDFDLYFAEADYVIFPWFLGVLRYEQANPEGIQTIRRIVPNTTFLYRANIKFLLETRLNPDDFKVDNFFAGLDFAF